MNEKDEKSRASQPRVSSDSNPGYMRLYRKKGEQYNDLLLADLAEIMRDSDEKRKARGTRNRTMPSGYVYFGQFIDHDLTRDGRTLLQTTDDVESAQNLRTPSLDLDQLYSESRTTKDHNRYDNDGHLLLGETTPTRSREKSLDDLYRTADGTAIGADPRKDENLILAQMHVLWSKFHNSLLDLLNASPELSGSVPGANALQKTQNLARWHYQWIVWYDFVPHIIQVAIQRDILFNGLRLFPKRYIPGCAPVALPVEFTMAAFRFGHSMVQQSYRINDELFLSIKDIIKTTKPGGGITNKLPADHVVDWRSFFGKESASLNRGESIDTFITETLFSLDSKIVSLFLSMASAPLNKARGVGRGAFAPCVDENAGTISLPCLTLNRGSRTRLPSGEDFARKFEYEPLAPEDVCPPSLDQDDQNFFEQESMRGRTPLWYYLLREAALENKQEPATEDDPEIIQKLGKIGSRIVAETIYQVLSADANSIFNAGSRWEPPFLEAKNGDPFRVTSMLDLIGFVRACDENRASS